VRPMNSSSETDPLSAVSNYRNIPTKIFETYTCEDKELLKILWEGIERDTKIRDFVRPIFTKKEFSLLLQKIYPDIYGDKNLDTLSQNLEFYIGGGYKQQGRKEYPNLFAKNLIRLYPFASDTHASYIIIVSFPFENNWNLNNSKLWRAKYPPHDPLHRVCMGKFSRHISTRILRSVNNGHPNSKDFKIPHKQDDSSWVLDDILYNEVLFGKRTLFIETYTGSEGYSQAFHNRLQTASNHIGKKPDDVFIFFFLLKKDVKKAVRSLSEFNKKDKNQINEQNIEFICYKEIDVLRNKLGLSNTYPYTPGKNLSSLDYYSPRSKEKKMFTD